MVKPSTFRPPKTPVSSGATSAPAPERDLDLEAEREVALEVLEEVMKGTPGPSDEPDDYEKFAQDFVDQWVRRDSYFLSIIC